VIAGCQRIVERRARPVVHCAWTEGNIALEEARPRDARRRILILGVHSRDSAEQDRSHSDEYTSAAHTSISD